MLRVVLDTNVYVAGLLSRDGSPATILGALADGAFDAVVCPQLLAELTGVLGRPKIADRVSPDLADSFMAWLGRVAYLVEDPAEVGPVSPDPGDDYLIALARSSGASFIVSGDAHLLGLSLRDPAAVSPATFRALLEALEGG